MTVSKNMTINPVTTSPEMGVFEAFELMKSEGVQRLPVLDSEGNLVGIISEKNITSAAADREVSIVEFALLLSKIKVGDVMTKEVITVSVDDPVEMAARKMSDNDISILPVVDNNGKLVGVVSRSDLFRLLLELFGTRHYGIRVTFRIKDQRGVIAKLAIALEKIGANIVSIGNLDSDQGYSTIIMKINGVDEQLLRDTLEPLVDGNLDIREG
ncbi:MAG: CBS domain-containing protein [Spirochaetales bacterium]|nr:CBS domain-containing protein [Spirochaetales bacterium]